MSVVLPEGYTLKRKAVAYITNRDSLLVFRHPLSPEAGVQVPAGTVKDGESPEQAALREAIEETGLRDVSLVQHLGTYHYDMTAYKPEIHERYVYHLVVSGDQPESWRHFESDVDGDTEGAAVPFDFYWVSLDSSIELIAGQGDLLHLLRVQV